MNTQLHSTKLIGALFLIALIPNIIANELLNPILADPDCLSLMYENRFTVITANLLNIICGIAMILIPVVLFPTVKKELKPFAIGYIVFRAIEGVLFFNIAQKTFGLIDLSRLYLVESGNKEIYQTLSQSTQIEIQWATLLYLITYCSGAMLFYALLFKGKMIPKWISVWGLAGVVLLAAGPVLFLTEAGIFKNTTLLKGMIYFAPPIILNEFLLSVWLIVRGFKTDKQANPNSAV
jgi:hypothetical protein